MSIKARGVLLGAGRVYQFREGIVCVYEGEGTEDIVQGLLDKIERLEDSASNGIKVIERLASKNEDLTDEVAEWKGRLQTSERLRAAGDKMYAELWGIYHKICEKNHGLREENEELTRENHELHLKIYRLTGEHDDSARVMQKQLDAYDDLHANYANEVEARKVAQFDLESVQEELHSRKLSISLTINPSGG